MDETRAPWNKGKALGQKRALSPDEVAVIKTVLGNKERLRDLTLFSLALDTLLRASDALALRVGDLQDAGGGIRDKLAILQKKTGRTLPVELSEATRATVGRWVAVSGKGPADFLFTSLRARPGAPSKPLTRRHYAGLVKQWAALVGIQDTAVFSTHSLRRTRAAFIYEQTKDLEAVRQVLGHRSLGSTSAYLGVDQARALDIARKYQL